jgi:hypothetical protein
MPPHRTGELDLHQIHTGRGNALLIVMPDATTVLVDAGDVPDGRPLELGPRRPNGAQSAGAAVAQYIRRLGFTRLDYAVFSHYHDDHIGGVADLAANIEIARWIDRGDQPAPPKFPVVQKYKEAKARFAGPHLSVTVGATNEIKPRVPTPGFSIRTVAANGNLWTGQGSRYKAAFPKNWQQLPPRLQPNENHFSVAFLIVQGAFRYFTGADLIGVALDGLPAWHDLETPLASAVGPVDVAVLNHHGWLDTTNEFFLRTLAPRVAILPAWHASHPDHGVLRRLRSPRGPQPDLFTTTLLDAPAAIFRYLGNAFQNKEGHVVVRVAPDGNTYQVFVLDAEQETTGIVSVRRYETKLRK